MSSNLIDPKRHQADALRTAIQKMGPFDESLYEKATLSKEKGVLDVMHRVLDDDKERREHDDHERSLIRRPLHVIIMDAFQVIREILADVSEAKTFTAACLAFSSEGRPAYLGVLLLMATLLAIIFDAMSH